MRTFISALNDAGGGLLAFLIVGVLVWGIDRWAHFLGEKVREERQHWNFKRSLEEQERVRKTLMFGIRYGDSSGLKRDLETARTRSQWRREWGL